MKISVFPLIFVFFKSGEGGLFFFHGDFNLLGGYLFRGWSDTQDESCKMGAQWVHNESM